MDKQEWLRKTRLWVCDKTRMCQITQGESIHAKEGNDGFREVTSDEWCDFCAVTAEAKSNGWKPGSRKPFTSFLPEADKEPQP